MLKARSFLAKCATAVSVLTATVPGWAQHQTLPADAESEVSADAEVLPENPADWQYQATLAPPAGDVSASSDLLDVFVPADVFRHSRDDLSDLRLDAADGSSIPFALRTLAARTVLEQLPTSEFNRSEPEGGVHEVTLEFSGDDPTHNQVVVETSGEEFRRSVVIAGSDDGKDWKLLVESQLLNLTAEEKSLIRKTFRYRESRHQFLRVQVTPDPQRTSSQSDKDAFTIDSVQVSREIALPAELVTTEAMISSREPTRQYGSPGSRWIMDFGAKIPVDRLEVAIKDREFARDVSLEAETVNLLGQPDFYPVVFNENSTWQRQQGDSPGTFTVTFAEVRSRRFRLTVADYRNKPLTLTSAKGSAPARQIVLQCPETGKLPVILRFGNPEAESPRYDFARNLPEALPTTPIRGSLGSARTNPGYTAPPRPFTERYPWFIYVALSSVSLALGAVVMNLSRAAIAVHDAADG